MLDPVQNLVKVTVAGSYDGNAFTILLNSGDGAKLYAGGGYNVTWWNITDYPDPSDDPNAEITRIASVVGDVVTLANDGTRRTEQEGIVPSSKNTNGKTYVMVWGITAKMITDIVAAIAGGQETPAGTVNGTNANFTVQNIPTFIVVGNSTFYPGDGYSISGSAAPYAITFDTPPQRNQKMHSQFGSLNNTQTLMPAQSIQAQIIIATTGIAVQLPGNPGLVNGIIVTAKSTNQADGVVGNNLVTNDESGAGNGSFLAPGASVGIGVSNSNMVWINGHAGDIFSFIGS